VCEFLYTCVSGLFVVFFNVCMVEICVVCECN